MYRLITCTTKTCGTTTCTCTYMYISVFDKLIWRTFGPKNFLFGTAQFSLWVNGTVDYDYIVTNSIKSSLIGSRCIPNGTATGNTSDHFSANLAHDQNLSKTLIHTMYITRIYIQVYTVNTGSCLEVTLSGNLFKK